MDADSILGPSPDSRVDPRRRKVSRDSRHGRRKNQRRFCALGLLVIPCGYVLGILYVAAKLIVVLSTSGLKVGPTGPSEDSIEEYHRKLAPFRSVKGA